MYRVLPYSRFEIPTRLPRDRAIGLLASSISARPSWYDRLAGKAFEGMVRHDRFRIHGAGLGQNAWLPYLYGRIAEAPEGSQIYVSATLHPVSAVVWVGVTIGLLSYAVIQFLAYTRGAASPVEVAAPIAVAVLLYVLGTTLFWSEVARAKALLADVFRDQRAA